MIIIGIYLVLLISIKLLNIFFISDLNTNIDDYILVYNHLKKSVIFLYCSVNINTSDKLYSSLKCTMSYNNLSLNNVNYSRGKGFNLGCKVKGVNYSKNKIINVKGYREFSSVNIKQKNARRSRSR